jgi:hypothetical protein
MAPRHGASPHPGVAHHGGDPILTPVLDFIFESGKSITAPFARLLARFPRDLAATGLIPKIRLWTAAERADAVRSQR